MTDANTSDEEAQSATTRSEERFNALFSDWGVVR